MEKPVKITKSLWMERYRVRVCCLVNTRSGGSLGNLWYERLSQIKQKYTGELQIEIIGSKPLSDIFSPNKPPYDLTVVFGGDGTFSSVIPYFLNTTSQLALVPLGTGNDLARELEIKVPQEDEFLKLLEQFHVAVPHRLTVWQVEIGGNLKYFVNYLSIGFDGDVIRFVESVREKWGWLSRWFGKFGTRVLYVVGGLWNMPKPPLADILVESDSKNVSLHLTRARTLFFSNIRSVMGLASSHPASSPFDCEIELTLLSSYRQYFGMYFPFLPWSPIHECGSRGWRVRGLPVGCSLQIDGEGFIFEGAEDLSIHYAGTIEVYGGGDKGDVE